MSTLYIVLPPASSAAATRAHRRFWPLSLTAERASGLRLALLLGLRALPALRLRFRAGLPLRRRLLLLLRLLR